MADPDPTVGELFKTNVVTHDDLNALVDALLDVAATVKASAFAMAVMCDEISRPGGTLSEDKALIGRIVLLIIKSRPVSLSEYWSYIVKKYINNPIYL